MPLPLSQFAMKLFVNPKPDADPKVPGLVWEAPPTKLTDSGHWEMTDAGQAMMRPRAGEPLVFMVEKSATATNNPFAMGVTIGRVESNDVVVDDGSVSRFHAWLQRDDRTQQWSLTDAESKNGTWVDGVKLAKARVALRDGAKLKFGDVEMEFYLPEALKNFVGTRFKGK